MRNNVNAILEGLHYVNEAALPKSVLSLMSDELKRDLKTFIDINNAKVYKVNGPRDDKYKNSYMRLYVLKDGVEYSKNDKVVIAYNSLYFDDPESITSKAPKWEIVNYGVRSLPKPVDVEEYYVLLNDDVDYNSLARRDSMLKMRDRKISRNTQDPHSNYAGAYVDGDGNITDKSAYYSAKVGEKTRKMRKDLLIKSFSDVADKYGFKFIVEHSEYTSNKIITLDFDDTKNQYTRLVVDIRKNPDIDMRPYVSSRRSDDIKDLNDLKNYTNELLDFCKRVESFEKSIKSNKDIKEALKLMKDNEVNTR